MSSRSAALRTAAFIAVVVSSVFAGWRFADQTRTATPAPVIAAARPIARTPAVPLPPTAGIDQADVAAAPPQSNAVRALPADPITRLPATVAAAATAPTLLEDVISRALPAVVRVETSGGYGTGFFISPDTILTNVHVVASNVSVTVRRPDGTR